MKHSQILEKVEGLIAQPAHILHFDRTAIISVGEAGEKFAGKELPQGDYAIVEVKLMIPLAGD